MVVCLYAHVGNVASEEGKSCETHTHKIFGAVGPNMWRNRGSFASEEGSSCEKLRLLGVMGGGDVGNFAPQKGQTL